MYYLSGITGVICLAIGLYEYTDDIISQILIGIAVLNFLIFLKED